MQARRLAYTCLSAAEAPFEIVAQGVLSHFLCARLHDIGHKVSGLVWHPLTYVTPFLSPPKWDYVKSGKVLHEIDDGFVFLFRVKKRRTVAANVCQLSGRELLDIKLFLSQKL